MGVGWPAALSGLAALLIPLLIHLLQRGEHRVVHVAITRFVPEQQRLRWRRLRLSQPILLALRLLLIGLAVLLLAEPYWRIADSTDTERAWTLISPQAEFAQADAGNGSRWLAPGFPLASEPRPPWQPGQLWSLLDAAHLAAPAGVPLKVVTPSVAAEFAARRAQVPRSIQWVAAPSRDAEIPVREPIRIRIFADADRQSDAMVIEQAVEAWRDAGIDVATQRISRLPLDASSAATVWLSRQPVPQDSGVWLTDQNPSSDALPVAFDTDGRASLRKAVTGAREVIYFAAGLRATDKHVSDASFALRLLQSLQSGAMQTPPADYPVSLSALTPSADSTQAQRRPLLRLFLSLILITALMERMLSAYLMRAT
ncbi:MAG: BatA domain-containing protein [Gammaproteobacteria bacterium]